MSAAKKIILLLWLVITSLTNASALTPGATETRVGQKSFAPLESRQAEPLQTTGLHQENASCGYELAPESLLAAKGIPPVKVLPSSGTKFVVDAKGNTIPLKPGETLTGSPNGKWLQVRDANGNPTGMRLDGGHKPTTHPDPRAQVPHGHVPDVTNPDGTPWLPVNQ